MAKRGLMAIASISVLIWACPTGHAASQDPTPREKACAAARADKQCGKDAKDCHYKFTVKKADGQNKLEVTYAPSVWLDTEEEKKLKAKEKEKEKEHKKKYEKYQFPIDLKQGSAAPTAGKTYFFTRCPDNEFTLGDEIDPNKRQ